MSWRLFLWEEELYFECCAKRKNFFLQVGFQDCWKWCPDPDLGYLFGGAYHLLTHTVSLTVVAHNDVM
jgi:hypothetical protein